MPQEQQLAHRNVSSTALPYISNQSPTVTDPCFIQGSTDLLTNVIGYCQRRFGFATTLEATATVFNNIQRIFPWEDNSGNFYVMVNDLNASGFSQVYKMQLGLDAAFVSIYTDTTANAFDFVVSNDTLYFGNGVAMKKWKTTLNPTLQNWGIAVGSINSSASGYAGTAVDAGGSGSIWNNPTNFQGAPDSVYTTSTYTAAAGGGTGFTNVLRGTAYGFGITGGSTITGVTVKITGLISNVTGNIGRLYLAYNGWSIGTSHTFTLTGSSNTFTLGSNSDQWGTALTTTIVNDASFGVQLSVSSTNNTGSPITPTVSFDSCQIIVSYFGAGGPPVSVSGSAGTMSATQGYEYVYCYYNSTTGHISSPTPVSASTGIFTSKLNVSVTLTASTDPQVTNIKVFRTTDSAPTGSTGGTFFELPTSPYPNTSGPITDNATDITLNAFSVAPIPTFNDPPPPAAGCVYFSGRIWMFTGNKVWFTGLEEILSGVPEECVPSGTAGNYWSFDQPVQGLGVCGTNTNQTLLIFCGGRVYGITGNTLDTFERFLISNRRGCRNRKTITMMGGICAWLDSAGQVWAANGSSMYEVSKDIRPDLAGINQQACSMSFHSAGAFHWLVLGTANNTFVFDVDTEQWMPPWSCKPTYLWSGETSPGNYVLLGAVNQRVAQLSTTAHNDLGTTYQPTGKTNLFALVPDFGRRFSYIAAGIYDEPSRTGYPDTIQFDTNYFPLSDVAILTDEDPSLGVYTSIFLNKVLPDIAFNRKGGQFLLQNVFRLTGPSARWISVQFTGTNEDNALKVYGWYVAYKGLGGR